MIAFTFGATLENQLLYLATGFVAGVSSGFFGIGGGTIVVPLLVALGESIKFAIGLSAMQMSFSSYYGTYINSKSGLINPKGFIHLGIGGVLGAALGAYLLDVVSGHTAAIVFSMMMTIALIRSFFLPVDPTAKTPPHWIFFAIAGFVVGAFSGLVGVGGGFLLVPILAGFMGMPLKNAVAVGLYFVMFVGSAAFITLLTLGYVDLIKGAILSAGSIAGVRLGILISQKTGAKKHKWIVVGMYAVLLSVMLYKIYMKEV